MTECKTITFRPTPEAEQHLETLMKRWGCKRTQAILRALAVASRPEIAAGNDQGSAVVARARLKRGFVANPVVDPEKMAEFQRKTGMTVYDKRRNRG